MINDIFFYGLSYYYDIEKCAKNILKPYDITISNNKEFGLLLKEKPVFNEMFNNTLNGYMLVFLKENEIDDKFIIDIRRDGVLMMKKALYCNFGNVKFRIKNVYKKVIKFNKVYVYLDFNDNIIFSHIEKNKLNLDIVSVFNSILKNSVDRVSLLKCIEKYLVPKFGREFDFT